ncbi:MAG: flagellar biosynthesis anti-sigma factor FlgM [Bacillota bacterium]|jgi:anti-sigma28 factor (negative regulator of flagellin synthesis)
MLIDTKNNIDPILQSTVRSKATTSEAETASSQTHKETAMDRVEISQKASDYDPVRAAKEKVVTEVEKGSRADFLRQLKADIENGAYHVSSQDIASAMINIAKKHD